MKRLSGILLTGALLLAIGALNAATLMAETAPGRTMARQAVGKNTPWITTDHSGHEILKQPFSSGSEVTKACLSCHNEAGSQVMKTIHWTWRDPNSKDEEMIGKAGLTLNNFCISIHGNEPRCTSCHAGYGWKDKSFDFTDETKIDCLVCHDQTGTYKKFPTKAGHPVTKPTKFGGKTFTPPDWNAVAQSVALPTRQNCGTCHFFGGGGDGVKHGDMDSSLFSPTKALDVHMDAQGKDFNCTRCHTTVAHDISGRTYRTPAFETRKSLVEDDMTHKITCVSCHTATPHKAGSKPNDHTDVVACQTCHIPTFAREKPTKMWWDWSKAGVKKGGKPYVEKGDFGKPVYMTKKGDMRWEKNVKPEYFWYNGSIETLTAKDAVNPATEIAVNRPLGDRRDENARIFPFKVHRAKQPMDAVSKTLAIPHLFGKKGSDAYWKTYDWEKAVASGMEKAGLPFSGELEFVETSYVFPITHMVAPKEQTVACSECHTRQGGRLQKAEMRTFYMPGRDTGGPMEASAWGLVIASLLGVFIHGVVRAVTHKKR